MLGARGKGWEALLEGRGKERGALLMLGEGDGRRFLGKGERSDRLKSLQILCPLRLEFGGL